MFLHCYEWSEKFWWKKNFMEISDSDLKFFRDLWRILIPCGLLSYAYYWLKYNFRSFPQSLDDTEHVRIHSMNIKFFFEKKVFIEISDPNLIFETESIWDNLTTCQLWVSKKKIRDIFSKIRFHSFVELDLENRLSTHNMVLSLELKAKKNIWWKIQKMHLSALLK